MTELYYPHHTVFGGLDAHQSDLAHAQLVVIPAPVEYTVSYGTGTARGPDAILAASAMVELYDVELDAVPMQQGIATLAELDFAGLSHAEALHRVQAAVAEVVAHQQLPITLGGEHSLTAPCVRAIQTAADFAPLGIVQFDAHSDLRQEYEETPLSHACAMRRTLEVPGVTLLEVGIRSTSPEEMHDLRAGLAGVTILWAHALHAGTADFAAALAGLPARVYITVDLDGFDPSIIPAVGTPEPGGLGWYEMLAMIRTIARTKSVVGADIVELAPTPPITTSDFIAAKFAYRLMGEILSGRRQG